MYRSGLGKTNLHGADSEIGHRAGHLLGLWLWIWWLAGWTLLASSTPSPLDLHQEVRQLVVDQSDPRPLVEEWLKATGDHSFEAFQSPSGRLREALVLQAAAAELWDEERYGQAGGLYSRARRMLESTGAWSEVAFCFYYQAEILSEQEQWAESLPWVEEGLGVAGRDSRPRPYLEGLLLQSKGYALWFLDQLPASIEAFGRAQQAWARIGFSSGITTSWNNLAVLYEELRLPSKAETSYREALGSLQDSTPTEIRWQLHANFALFLHKLGDRPGALVQLAKAEKASPGDSAEILMLRARLDPWPDWRRRIEALPIQSTTQRIERALLLASNATDSSQARQWYEAAWSLGQTAGQQQSQRQVAVEFGSWLEARAEFKAALELYGEALQHERRPGVVFPYSRAVSPLLDGVVRILVRQGRADEARKRIQQHSALRLRQAVKIQWGPTPEAGQDLTSLTEAARLESDFRAAPALDPPPPIAASPDYSILEMWPDGNQVFVWLDGPRTSSFSRMVLRRPVSEVVAELAGDFYGATSWLPPPPSPRVQRELGLPLMQVLSRRAEAGSLLVVAHKELQALPLGILRDGAGRYLDDHFSFSYLPSLSLAGLRDPVDSPPILVLPGSSPSGENTEVADLQKRFPDLVVVRGFSLPDPVRSRWMHISSHFQLETDFWPASRFAAAGETLGLGVFLQRDFALRLLSIGACDLANSYSMASPYWFGLAELVMARPIESMLVSRWKLDELSSRIYIDFFDRAKTGVSMDQALTGSRRAFRSTLLRRGKSRISGEHPFFWAGITYIGRPGLTLYDPAEHRFSGPLVVLFVVALIVGYSALRLLIMR